MVKSKIIAIMAVMCLAFAGIAVVISDDEVVAEDAKYVTVTYDGVIAADAATAMFAAGAVITYETTLDEAKLESVLNYEAYQLLKNATPSMISGSKIIVPVAAGESYMDAAEKVGMGDTKTVVKVAFTSDVAYAFYTSATVAGLEADKALLETEKAALETEKAALVADKAALETEVAALETDKAALEKSVKDKDAAIAEKDAAIAEKDAAIAEKDDKIAELEKEQPKVPFYETTMGQVAIILAAFVLVLLVYYNFDAIKTKLSSLKGVKP